MNRYFQTFNGKRVHPFSPNTDEILIEDVAHSLSQQCRFLGHTRSLYTVAQHSVLVSEMVPRGDALWGLLHDASEAYMGDLPAPIKRDRRMQFYRIAEDHLLACIVQKFGLPPEMPESVKRADKILLATEFRDVTNVDDLEWVIAECGCEPAESLWITPWAPAVVEHRFLTRFQELTV